MANNSLSSDGVTIWLAPASTAGTDLEEKGKKIQSFVTNFEDSGGTRDTESVPVFGGGNIKRKKPQEQKELSFDVKLRHNDDITIFKKMEAGKEISPDGDGDDFKVGMVAVQHENGDDYYYQAYNNCDVTVFETEFPAEEEWSGTLNIKLSPTDPDGKSNLEVGDADITSDLESSEDNSW